MPLRRSLVILALVAGLLTGCGDDPVPRKERGPGPRLTAAQATSVLLAKGDLGPRFRQARGSDDDDLELGCLDRAAKVSGPGPRPAVEKEIAFAPATRLGMPLVTNDVASFASEQVATQALEQLSASLDACTRVNTVSDGVRIRLELTGDQLPLAPEADQQVNLRARGAMTIQGRRIPMVLEISVVRVGRNTVMVLMADLTDSVGNARRDLTDAAVERLLAVVDGEELPAREPILADYDLVSVADLR